MVADLAPCKSECLLEVVVLVVLQQGLLFVVENAFNVCRLHFVKNFDCFLNKDWQRIVVSIPLNTN
jgi:hypothetical protein